MNDPTQTSLFFCPTATLVSFYMRNSRIPIHSFLHRLLCGEVRHSMSARRAEFWECFVFFFNYYSRMKNGFSFIRCQ